MINPAINEQKLGGSGPKVSRFGLGALALAGETDAGTAERILDRYVELGGRHIDVADVYGQGRAEQLVGDWLARRAARDDVVVASKIGQAMTTDPEARGLDPQRVGSAVRASLARLGTDRLDLLYLHCWDPNTPLDDTLDAVQELVDDGLVLHVGVSNYLPSQLQRATLLQQFAGRTRIAALQAQYSLLTRDIEWELLGVCQQEGVGLTVWSPLCGGWLAGAFSRDTPPPEGHPRDRSIFAYRYRANSRTWRILDAVDAVATRHGATMAQVALRWLMDKPFVDSILLGPASVTQLEENLAAADLVLSQADHEELEEVSAPAEPDYPHGFARMLAQQFTL